MRVSCYVLVAILSHAIDARPPVAKRQDYDVVWETDMYTATTSAVVATTWATVQGVFPTVVAKLNVQSVGVSQTQVIVNEIQAQYSYSSARTVFVVGTTVSSTATRTATVMPYTTLGSVVHPPSLVTITNTINALETPIGSNVGQPLTGTLPAVSVLISGDTVTVSEQTFTYYTPVVDYAGHTVQASATMTAAPTVAVSSVSGLLDSNQVKSKGDSPSASLVPASLELQTAGALSQSSSNLIASTTNPVVSTASSVSSIGTSLASLAGTSTTMDQTQATPVYISESGQDSFVSTVLNSMNQYRAQHSAPSLTWNYDLAASALQFAQSCQFDHTSGNSIGETLAAGTSDDPNFYISLWYAEGANYNYYNPGFSDSTGHFTQLVWASTTSVGCGFSSGCGQYANYFVCRYSNAGNIVGGTNNNQYFIDNVKP